MTTEIIKDIRPQIIEILARGPQGVGGAKGNYGSFYDTSNQPLLSTLSEQVIDINSTLEAVNISIENDNEITFAEGGTYSMTFSIQFTNTENNTIHTAAFWLKYNGDVYPNSASQIEVPGAKGGTKGATIATVNFVSTATAGDVVQLFWSASSTNVSLETYTNGLPGTPASPSIILTVVQVMYTQEGDKGDKGDKGDTGDVNPEMYTILQDAEDARDAAQGYAQSADLDAQATAADRIQTGLDVIATTADRVQTGLDAVATAADRVQTGLDAAEAANQAGIATVQAGLAEDSADAAALSAQEAYTVSRAYVNLVLMGF